MYGRVVRIVAVANQKGGVGKTTTAVNLAATIPETGRSCLLIDLDPQANATRWLGVDTAGRALHDLLVEGGVALDTLACPTPVRNLEVIPSSRFLAGAERALAARADGEKVLRDELRRLPGNRWDYVFLDCPPSLGALVLLALTAATDLLIPVGMSALSLQGLGGLLETVRVVRRRLNPELGEPLILACQVGRTRLSREVIEELRRSLCGVGIVLDQVVRDAVAQAEAPGHRLPITCYAPRSAAASDYRGVALELFGMEVPA